VTHDQPVEPLTEREQQEYTGLMATAERGGLTPQYWDRFQELNRRRATEQAGAGE
jgi:hypothetical protein